MKSKLTLFVFFFTCVFLTNVFAEDVAIYVVNSAPGTVSVIDPDTDTVADTFAVGDEPKGIVILPDMTGIYVANSLSSDVTVIDPTDNSIVDSIDVGTSPEALVASPDGSKVYVTNTIDDTVSIIDTTTNTVTGTINVGNTPRGITITPDGAFLYVANFSDDTISVVDLSDNSVTTINLAGGSNPIAVLASHDGDFVYVSNFIGSTVEKIDTSDNSVGAAAAVGFEPFGLVLTSDDSLLYVMHAGGNEVTLVTTATMAIDDTVAVGNFPRLGVLNEDETKLYVTEFSDNTVGIIDTDTLAPTTLAVGNSPYGIALLLDEPVNDVGLSIAISTYANELYQPGLAIMDSFIHYQMAVENSGTTSATSTVLSIESPYNDSFVNIHTHKINIENLDGDAGNVVSSTACTEVPSDSGIKVLNCNVGTINAGDTRYFTLEMHVGYGNGNHIGYSRYSSDYTATATSGDATSTATISLTAVSPRYPDCTCRINPNQKFDFGQEIKNTFLMLTFLILPLLAFRLRKLGKFLSVLMMIFLYSSPSMAATNRFSVNPDMPALGSSGIIYTQGAKNSESPYYFSFDTQYGYNHSKFSGVSTGIVNHLVTHNLGFSFAPKQKWGLDIIVPIISVNKYSPIHASPNKAGIGDVYLRGHIPLAQSQTGKIHAALVPFLSIPTGNENYFIADKYPRGGLVGALDWQMNDRWYSAVNLGVEVRQSVQFNNYQQKGRILGSIGTSFAVCPQVNIKADLVGSTALDHPFTTQPTSPLEALGGLQVDLKNHPVSFNVSGGAPLVRGATSPTFRVNTGLTVALGKRIKGLSKADLQTLQPTLYFNSASAKISDGDQSKLDQVANLLKANPKVKLIVAEGHTDNQGTTKINQKLSIKRATAVKNYLLQQKINSNRIQVAGLAATKPLMTNTTDKGRSQNRRVELRVEQL